jgi:hypothetical protein
MTDTSGGMPPAGWYPDPYGAPVERWWDGTGWTEHTNSPQPIAPEPAAPAAPSYEQPAYEQPAYEQPAYEQPAYEQPAYEQPAYEQPTYQQPTYEQPAFEQPAAYTPPPLQEPQAPAADPFASFATTGGQPSQPGAYLPSVEPPAFEPEAAAWSAATQTTPPAQPAFAADLFGQQPAVTPEPAPASASAAGGFDFGFNDIISGGPAAAEAGAAPAAGGDDGLFGSWQPNEYVEPPSNGAANTSLGLGIASFFLSVITGIPGIILGSIGLARAARFERDGDGPVGRGKAITGIALSIVASGVSAALIWFTLGSLGLLPSDTPEVDQPGIDSSAPGDDAERTVNGGYAMEIGDLGTITLPDSDAAAIQFTVTSITPNFTCTAADSVSPENGQFIAVGVSFTLSADYLNRMESGLPLHMYQSDWIGYTAGEDGVQVDSTDAGSLCIPEDQMFPGEFAAGENLTGIIVLDMTPDTASISYAPSGVLDLDPGITRWEWLVPAP